MASELWVCAGERRGKVGGKSVACLAWWQLHSDGKAVVGKEMLFPKSKGAWAGNVYEVNATRGAGDAVSMSISKRVSTYDNRKLEAEWSAMAAAARTEARAQSDEKKARTHVDDVFKASLEPLHRAYQRCGDPIGREVIIARAIRFITRGG